MKQLRRPVYFVSGHYTVSLGTGRKEFHPKKPRPGIEHYVAEAGKGALAGIDPRAVDQGVVGNFIAARFVRQGHLGAMLALVDPSLAGKPSLRVEGACASGGLALVHAIDSVLAEHSDVTLAIGVEVQNTVKAIYGADILAAAGHFSGERKNGHAYFFPAKFSDRAGAYKEKYGAEKTWAAMGRWYEQALQNARLNPKAQEHENATPALFEQHQALKPNPKSFCEHINVLDCSKVSDGGAAVLVVSDEGLGRLGKSKAEAVELVGLGHCVADLTAPPADLAALDTTRQAVEQALAMAGIGIDQVGVIEIHDCFTITAILACEALGLAKRGAGADYVLAGKTRRDGASPINTGGGLVGYGHPTGASGVRMAVDLLAQLTGKAGGFQVQLAPDRRYGLLVNMGGNDKTVVSCIFKSS
ncbi:MAG: 3-ketoacyl-CoA thiolase [Acidobacteria bacterium]|nr:3-ketoacyl-CoA thiolase [Acidobacteriota bacterium]